MLIIYAPLSPAALFAPTRPARGVQLTVLYATLSLLWPVLPVGICFFSVFGLECLLFAAATFFSHWLLRYSGLSSAVGGLRGPWH